MTTKITADNIEQSTLDILDSSGPAVANVKITSNSYAILDDTAVSTDGGYIIVNGSNFEPNVNVLIDQTAATSVTRVSATQLRVQVPALSAGSKILYVVNSDTGATTILLNGVTYSGTPTWVTGSTLTEGAVDAAISIQLSASSDSNVSYQLQAGSTLPAGLTLAANGLLSGTVTDITVDTLYNFTVEAVDTENQESPRSFTITISVAHRISRSLRFNSADSAYLSRTPASAGNRKTWTWSGWVKRGTLSTTAQQAIFSASPGTSFPVSGLLFTDTDTIRVAAGTAAASNIEAATTAVYRDTSAWYHIVLAVDTTQATDTNRVKVYVNGSLVSLSGTLPAQNYDGEINNNVNHGLGAQLLSGPQRYFNGYLTEINFIDGQALTPSSFGEINATTGVWSPIAYAGSYGTNGFYLDFSDNSGVTSTTLGKDQAGSNNWTPYNFSVAAGAGNDSFVDSPTQYGTDTGVGGEVRGNYCTLNPLDSALTGLNNGNLNSGTSGAANWKHCRSTFAMSTGKWYWECLVSGAPDASNGYQTGVLTGSTSLTANPTSASTGFYTRQSTNKYANGTLTDPYFTSTTSNDVLMFAFDADAGKMWNGKNGTWEVSGDPAAGTSENWASVPAGVFPMAGSYGSSLNITVNFGQRPFAYTAPSGFKALCTQNLPEPTVVQGDDYFNTVLYTGTGTTPQSITGVGFEPDMVWLKSRSTAWTHGIFTKLNGIGAGGGYKYLATNTTAGELDTWGSVAFNSDGWTGVSSGYNGSFSHDFGAAGQTFVSWNWNAGGSTVTNTAGSIQSQVMASPTAGFSIVSFTDVGSACTVGHGLGVAPAMIIAKFRGASGNWSIYHQSLGNTYRLRFTSEAQLGPSADWWNNTSPTSTVFSLGSGLVSNTTQVAYCFAEVEGYSKFGSYTGNGSADGPFIYTGFRPAFVILKAATVAATNWQLNDSARDTFNVVNKRLAPSAADAEATNFNFGDFLSNGFKIRQTDQTWNTNGATYIYMAFAENPFKYSLAR